MENTQTYIRAFNQIKTKSTAETIELIRPEWRFIGKYQDKGVRCVCNKPITNCILYANETTGQEIIMGSSCAKLLRIPQEVKVCNNNRTEDFYEKIVESKIRNNQPYNPHLIDEMILFYTNKLEYHNRSIEIKRIKKNVELVIQYINDNELLKSRLEILLDKINVKYTFRSAFCNGCCKRINPSWSKHPCNTFNCVCLNIRTEYCLTCAEMEYC